MSDKKNNEWIFFIIISVLGIILLPIIFIYNIFFIINEFIENIPLLIIILFFCFIVFIILYIFTKLSNK